MVSGHIFFDNNTLGEIHRRSLVPRIVRSLRAVDLSVQPTELNLLEGYSAPEVIADQIVATLRDLAGREGALPWTGEVLRLSGEAFLRGEMSCELPLNEVDPALMGSREALREKLSAWRKQTDGSHQLRHAVARRALQAKLKARGLRPMWEQFPAFLEEWQRMELREIFARQSWADLDLPEPFQVEILSKSDSWRLMCDADAVGLYQTALAFDQPRQVQRMDQLQLPYLGGTSRRILVTRDGPFAQVAKMVVNGRYHLASVLTLTEFLENSGIS